MTKHRNRRIAVMSAGALAACAVSLAGAEEFLWIEGESAARHKTHHNAWFETVCADELSGGAQIANFSEPREPEGWAEYDVTVPKDAKYHFWLRANPNTGISRKLDGGPEVTLDAKAMQEEDKNNRKTEGYVQKVRQFFNVAADGAHDARTMTWYYLGLTDLTAGRHTFRFSLGGTKAEKRFAAIDCFVLTTGAFEPNFQYKPGEQPKNLVTYKREEVWDFAPERDAFAAEAIWDLRGLNEEVAGQHGFIRLSRDGNDFLRGDGRPVRFWGGTDYVQRDAQHKNDQGILEHHARFLAKRGVNIARLHGAIQPKEEGSKVTDVDEKELDQIYRLVAAMKKAGIYTIISPYWGSHAKWIKSWGVANSGTGNCSALVFFDAVMQQGFKAWLKRIYADVNPYTGIPLARDPAVAIIQIQNEDSMLFWTMQGVKKDALHNLRKMYGDWLLKKYGSFEKTKAAWKGYDSELLDQPDDFENGRPGMYIVWELTQSARNKKGGPEGREERLADQCEFMARTMYDFNAMIARYLRKELGCRQLINAGNWRSADQVVLDDAERWSYTANEVIGKNHYFGGLHKGINEGWQILPGQVFTSRSFALNPFGSPLFVRQVAGHPFIVPESLWVPPMRYQAEGPLVVAAQSCLSGLDTFFWFATGAEEWQTSLNKWTFALPTMLGQFPAAALIFRKGYVKPGPVVVHEERSLQDIWCRKLPVIAEEGAWDPNRDKGEMPLGTPVKAAVDPIAHLVGRVEVAYGGKPARSTAMDLSPFTDRDKSVVKSATGEITTDMKRGLYLVNAPCAQGAAGFLGKSGALRLGQVTIDCANDYASIVVVPLDDKPILSSAKLLIQAGTVCRPTGWIERKIKIPRDDGSVLDGSRIIETGLEPWQVENTRATVTVANRNLSRAVKLDANGMQSGELPIERSESGVKVVLPPDAIYTCLW